jgi:peptide/nickel transport system substrate-binding protein
MRGRSRIRAITRRELLKYSGAAAVGTVLVSCLPEGSATPSAMPSETTGSAGKYRLGKLEGAEVVTDATKFPRSFKEAPELATLVQQGKLPPVAERIGQDPLVLQPAHGIGKYGGTLRKGALPGVDAAGNIHRFASGPATLLYFDYKWTKIVPNLAREFEQSADGKVLTIRLRRGMRWSDGQPFTADDIVFWYEDIYLNKQLFVGTSPDLLIGGREVKIEKVDQYTVRYVSPEANSLLVERLASPLTDFGGPTFRGQTGRGGYAPKHYLSRFLPKYAGQAAVDKLAADAKHNSWVTFFYDRNNWRVNTELPVLAPWKVTVPATNPSELVLERNPYSVWVDSDGNQLPYIGKIQHTIAENREVIALRVTSGEIDFQDHEFDVAKLPVLIDSESRGGYKIQLDPSQSGLGIALNLAYDADPEVGEWIRNVDFRRALSLGIDRGQINEALFLGTGTPSSSAPADDNKYSPGKEWRTKWATHDVAQANQLLDKIGLTNKDSEGYRLRKDGTGRLRLTFMAVIRIADFAAMAEMLKQQWKAIGVDLVIEPASTQLGTQRISSNQAQMTGNQVGAEDVFLFGATLTPQAGGFSAIMGVPYAQWQATGGRQGKEPFPELKKAMELVEKGKLATQSERIEIGKEITRIHLDNVFSIGIVQGDLASSAVRVAKTTLGNVPGRIINAVVLLSTNNLYPQTFYFK